MTTPHNEHRDVDTRDLRICRYLDGSMPPEQRARFERDMLRDPSLHRETEAFAQTDRQVADALDALLTPQSPRSGRRQPDAPSGIGIRRLLTIAATLVVAATAYVVIYAPGWPIHERTQQSPPSATEENRSEGPEAIGPTDGYSGSAVAGTGSLKNNPGKVTRRGAEVAAAPIPDMPVDTESAAAPSVLLGASFHAGCGDTPVTPAETRDLSRRIRRARDDCSPAANVTREYIGVVDEDRGEVYMIQLDHVEGKANHAEADL